MSSRNVYENAAVWLRCFLPNKSKEEMCSFVSLAKIFVCKILNIRDWSKSKGGGGPEQRVGGSSVFEPLARGGSCNFKLPVGMGHPVFIMGFDTHLTQSTTKVTLFEQ